VETPQRFAEIALDWDELYRSDPNANFYVSTRFLASITKIPNLRLRAPIAWSDDKRCIGALPLQVRTRWDKADAYMYNELHMLGRVFDADYTGILCHPAEEQAVCEAFGETVSDLSFTRLIVSNFFGPMSRLERFCGAFDPDVFDLAYHDRRLNAGETDNLVCPYVDLPDEFSDYLETLSSNARQKLRRALRRFEGDPELRITRASPETYKRDADILCGLWLRQHGERKGRTRAARLAEQCREILLAGLANGLIHLPVFWRADTPLAAHAVYVDPVKRHALFHVSGRDEAVRDLPIGLLLHAHSIRWSIAQGLRRYDFTLGDEPYKYSLGAADRQIAYLEIATKNRRNTDGGLDKGCRGDAAGLIRRFAAKGRAEEGAAAARQALQVWPELSCEDDILALSAQEPRSRPRAG